MSKNIKKKMGKVVIENDEWWRCKQKKKYKIKIHRQTEKGETLRASEDVCRINVMSMLWCDCVCVIIFLIGFGN